jgi:hypothetical protein
LREEVPRDRKKPKRRATNRVALPVRMPRLFGLVRRHPGDMFCAFAATAAIAAIISNALYYQPGPHPSPIFAIRPLPVVSREAAELTQMPKPRPVAAVAKPEPAPALKLEAVPLPRPRVQPMATAMRADPIADLLGPAHQISAMQRVLNEFGYGPIKVSGSFDDETRQGIERFERDHNLPVTGQNSPRLRRALSQATGRPLD